MEVINTLGSLIVILFLISLPVYWIWAGYHLDVKRKVIVLIENVPIGECVSIMH